MLKSELYEIIANGENSRVEFKRDDCQPEDLIKEIVAMANHRGGMVLLGVEDDGSISGIARDNLEEWAMDAVVGRAIHPVIVPYYEEVQVDDRRVAVMTIEQGVAKPYVRRHNDREEIFMRIGSVSKLATRELQARLFESGGMLATESLPVSGTSIESLDIERIKDYLRNILKTPNIPDFDEA